MKKGSRQKNRNLRGETGGPPENQILGNKRKAEVSEQALHRVSLELSVAQKSSYIPMNGNRCVVIHGIQLPFVKEGKQW